MNFRQAIDPVIGHLKPDHRMSRWWLKGAMGDAINAVLSAAGYNIWWLLRMILKKGIGLYLVVIRLLGLGGLFDRKPPVNQLDRSVTAQLSLSPG